MALIIVPKPSKHAMNPDRPVSGLLLAQIEHLHVAEKNLPLRYRSDKYIKAIRTEREAATYIKQVTEAIHQAHKDAATHRAKAARRRGTGLEIAASAERSKRKRSVKIKKVNKRKKK
jgi:hypothetical protein